jgi:predicted Zn finger-like uncharacterized protein
MRIVCPRCTAAYEVPTALLKPGKLVRCAQCSSDWLPGDEAEDVDTPSEPPQTRLDAEPEVAETAPAMTAMDRLAAYPPPRPPRAGLISAWLLTFAVLTAAVAATIGWRDAIIQAWPPSGWILSATGQTSQPAHIVGKNAE